MKVKPFGHYLETPSIEEPKAEIEIYVKYLGKEYELFDDLDVSYGFWEALGDMVAALDHDIRVAREKRLKLKATLKRVV